MQASHKKKIPKNCNFPQNVYLITAEKYYYNPSDAIGVYFVMILE